ncbi:MAG: PspC domain-containing protein [Candidatus Eisenbacteria sp.]|nr:PspC domain-containing protein [Candidatus Eisenbacteria bacterium]
MNETTPRRLHRSEKDRKIAGLCGGVAEYLNVDPTMVRLAAVILAAISGLAPMVIGYLVAILIVPLER